MDGQAKVSLLLELKNRISTGLTKAKESLNSNVRDMKDKLRSLKTSHIETFKAMSDQIPGFSQAMSMLANPYVLVTAGLLALGTAGFKAAQWSNQFQTKMAEVNVTAGLSHKELNKLSDKLVDIGVRNVAPLEQVPDAFNRIISAGLDVNTSLKVLEPTLRAAKAGFTDMETVAAAGVGVMNSSGEDINRVYDILFMTLNKGNAKFQDIAHYLPKIVPLAKGAGFALAETAGAWAFLTAQGQSAEQATTGITNMVKALSTGSTVKGLKSVGINIYTDKGKIKPIVEVMDLLSKKMAGLSDAGRTKFLEKAGITDMEAKGAIMSMVQNMDKLRETTDAVKDSQGALNKAYKDAKTDMDDWKLLMNQLYGNVVKPLGDALLHIFGSIARHFTQVDPAKQIREETIRVNALADELRSASTPLQRRNEIYAELKGIAPDVVKGIDAEKIALGLLNANLDEYNKKAMHRITIAKSASKLEPFQAEVDKYAELTANNYSDMADKIATEKQRRLEKYGIDSEQYKSFNNILNKSDLPLEKKYTEFLKLKDFIPGDNNIRSSSQDYAFYKDQLTKSQDRLKEEMNRQNERLKLQGINPLTADTTPPGGTPPPDPDKPTADDSINKITGSAKQIRNITINIDSFVKGGINTEHTNMQQMDEKQIEAYIRDMFMRVIANVETSYQGG